MNTKSLFFWGIVGAMVMAAVSMMLASDPAVMTLEHGLGAPVITTRL